MKAKYMAIAVKDGWTVANQNAKPLGNVRKFKSYEEADEAAKYIADGKFDNYEAGTYIANR